MEAEMDQTEIEAELELENRSAFDCTRPIFSCSGAVTKRTQLWGITVTKRIFVASCLRLIQSSCDAVTASANPVPGRAEPVVAIRIALVGEPSETFTDIEA